MLSKLVIIPLALSMLAPPGAKRELQDERVSDPSLSKTWDDEVIEEATKHFREGQRQFDAKRFLQAAVEFERSHAAIAAGETLYNIALSYERAERPADALAAAQRYLDLPECGGKQVDPIFCARRRKEVERTVERLRERVGELTLEMSEDARVKGIRVDDRVLEVDDFPVMLDPGPIEVEILGEDPDDRRLRVLRLVPGKTTTLRVEPFVRAKPEVPEPRPPSVSPAVEEPTSSSLRRGFWSGLGLTLLSGASVAVLGGLSLHHRERFSDALCRGVCNDPEASYPFAARTQFENLKLATNVMIGVTAGLAAMTVALGVTGFRSPRRGRNRRARLILDGAVLRF